MARYFALEFILDKDDPRIGSLAAGCAAVSDGAVVASDGIPRLHLAKTNMGGCRQAY